MEGTGKTHNMNDLPADVGVILASIYIQLVLNNNLAQ